MCSITKDIISIVIVSWERGGVCVGGGVQFHIFLFIIFFSFCRNLPLNHVNFRFPAMFFFLQLY